MMVRVITERMTEDGSDAALNHDLNKREGAGNWRSRLLWFVGIWAASVMCLGVVSILLRWVLLGG